MYDTKITSNVVLLKLRIDLKLNQNEQISR